MNERDESFKELCKAFNDYIFSDPLLAIAGLQATMAGRPFDLKPLFFSAAMIARDIRDYLLSLYTFKRESDGAVIGYIHLPKVVFSADIRPNAHMSKINERDREIQVNLGLVMMCCSLPKITSFIMERLHRESVQFTEIEQHAKSGEFLKELDNLMNCLTEAANRHWSEVRFPSGEPSEWWLFQEMERFVIAHEFAHWLLSVYKAEESKKLLQRAESDIKDWLRIANASRDGPQNSTGIVLPGSVLANWAREVCADQMGFQICLNTFGGQIYPKLRMTAYVGAALVFAMIGMLEMFFETIGVPLSTETHPPSIPRATIFTYSLAKQYRISHNDFLVKEFGAGTMVLHFIVNLLSEYVAWKRVSYH